MIITQMHLVLGAIKGHSKMCSFVIQHNATDVSSWGRVQLACRLSTRAVARELNVNFSTISHLQSRFREFGSTSNRPHNRRPHVWRCVGKRFADGDCGVMEWAGINYGQRTHLHFIDGNLNAQILVTRFWSPLWCSFFLRSLTNRCKSVFPVMWNP